MPHARRLLLAATLAMLVMPIVGVALNSRLRGRAAARWFPQSDPGMHASQSPAARSAAAQATLKNGGDPNAPRRNPMAYYDSRYDRDSPHSYRASLLDKWRGEKHTMMEVGRPLPQDETGTPLTAQGVPADFFPNPINIPAYESEPASGVIQG
eukprot:PLAT5133.1.p1 GENE.PLAT5133.1~~PLAT5133.1.p1  ORF type:complete len:162 (+),score=25.03 PLAT5133.1:30-488(+)